MAASRLFVDPKPASKRSAETVGRNYLNGRERSPALPQDIYFRTPEVNIRALYVSFEIPATTKLFLYVPTSALQQFYPQSFDLLQRYNHLTFFSTPACAKNRDKKPTKRKTMTYAGLSGQNPPFPGHGLEWPPLCRPLAANGCF